MEPNTHCQLLGVYPEALMSDTGSRLRGTISALWQMENELRFSAWHALTLDKQKAQEHLALAREHLNSLLNKKSRSTLSLRNHQMLILNRPTICDEFRTKSSRHRTSPTSTNLPWRFAPSTPHRCAPSPKTRAFWLRRETPRSLIFCGRRIRSLDETSREERGRFSDGKGTP